MPARNEIQREIIDAKNAAQDNVRRKYLKELSDHTNRDCILYATAFSTNKGFAIPAHLISINIQDIQGFMAALHELKNDQLDLILHSPGGSLEAAEQIVNYLRAKYKHIRAIIPQNAMSAATIIACGCDEIILGKHSAIGPIDPQLTYPTDIGPFTAPAQSILEEFEQAKREISANPATAGLWVNKMQKLPFGILDICRKTTTLSITIVKKWLEDFMFKGDANRTKLADDISKWLGTASNHNTHGKPINIGEARARGLKVSELERDQKLQELVLSVFHAAVVTLEITNTIKLTENNIGKGLYIQIQPEQLILGKK